MKTSLSSLNLLLLLLLFFLILSDQVQGIRLEKGFSSARHQKIQVEEEGSPIKIRSNGGVVGEVTLCRNGHCSSGINRKLMTMTTSTSTTSTTTTTTTTNSKNMKNGGNSGDEVPGREEENFYVNGSPEGFPDIIDIAGMDYSPARRKPPIHN